MQHPPLFLAVAVGLNTVLVRDRAGARVRVDVARHDDVDAVLEQQVLDVVPEVLGNLHARKHTLKPLSQVR